MSSLILAVDTSSQAGSVALLDGDVLLGEVLLNVRSTHSERLLYSAKQLLADTGRSLEQLDALAVVRGPGSFTGLRVGLGTVQGLALGLNRPVVSVSSLATLALNAAGSARPVWALLDARKQEVYAAPFTLESGWPEPLGAEQVVPPEQVIATMEGEVTLVGVGAEVYRDKIQAALGDRAHFLPGMANLPRAAGAGLLAQRIFAQGGGVEARQVRPVYLRPSEAEITQQKVAD